MSDVRRRHNGHWFDPASMRFFRSRVAEIAYETDDGKRAYFVSSEQFVPSAGPARARRWSVRVIDYETDDISTAGEFQEFSSRNGAKNTAMRLADGGPIDVPGHPGRIVRQ